MPHKGRRSPQGIDREFPHQVEVAVPPGGLGDRLTAFHAACKGIDHTTRGIGRKQWLATGRDAVRFCFKSAEQADAFQAQFGGERFTIG